MEIKPEDLIHLIVWCASRRREKLTTLRLVKFLYLADLYYARLSQGETLTGWPWAFIYYGPFCHQASEAIDNAIQNDLVKFEERPSKYDNEKDYRLFWVEDIDEEPNLAESFPTYLWSRLQWAIQKWADDSYGLLDYVYFETEPMVQVRRGDVLDFKIAQMPEIHKKVEMKKISKSKIEVAKKVVNQLKEKYKQAIGSRAPGGPIDASYFKAISQLEGEDLEVGLEGIAELGNLESEPKP